MINIKKTLVSKKYIFKFFNSVKLKKTNPDKLKEKLITS